MGDSEDDGTLTAASLRLDQLLRFDPSGGVITFAGERVLLIDAIALGMLRQQLVELLGLSATRRLLTHFGYLHGWRTADSLKDALPWKDEREWRVAGGRLHRLHGLVSFAPTAGRPEGRSEAPFASGLWDDSYEAEQHLLHLGRSEGPVCWSLTGFASGYLSRVTGKTIYCLESQCRGRGDPICHMEGRPKDEWGEEHQHHFSNFESDSLGAQLEQMLGAIKQAERRLTPMTRSLQKSSDCCGLVTKSSAQRAAVEQARRLAGFDVTVLLTGESGAGKKTLARLIHDASARQNGPFIVLNCATVPEPMLEAELFGRARGTELDRLGAFASARRGTLLLDEVGDLPWGLQARVLGLLREKGSANRAGEPDARLIAASQHDLRGAVASGLFRRDLYYRLKVVELEVSPLRARPEDIVPLAELALAREVALAAAEPRRLSAEVQRLLLQYPWPGNVRELENTMARAVVMSAGPNIEVGDLPDEIVHAPPGDAIGRRLTLAAVEQEHVLGTLDAVGGDAALAAERLHITRAQLARKLKTYGDAGSSS